MFGLSFTEIMVLLVVAIVVVGPRQLPTMLRTAGRWIAKARRALFDMRSQSGIDEILKQEGLAEDLQALRAIVRGNMLENLRLDLEQQIKDAGLAKRAQASLSIDDDVVVMTDHEYPIEGCDAYGAVREDMQDYLQDSAPVESPGEEA